MNDCLTGGLASGEPRLIDDAERDTRVLSVSVEDWQVKAKMCRFDGDGQITVPYPVRPLLPSIRSSDGDWAIFSPFLPFVTISSFQRPEFETKMLVPKRLGG